MENRINNICAEINDMFYGCFVQQAVDREDYETAKVCKDFIDELDLVKNKI
jgi:hypothetical protein